MGHLFCYDKDRKTKEVFVMTQNISRSAEARYHRLLAEKKRLKEEKEALIAFSLVLMSVVGLLLVLI